MRFLGMTLNHPRLKLKRRLMVIYADVLAIDRYLMPHNHSVSLLLAVKTRTEPMVLMDAAWQTAIVADVARSATKTQTLPNNSRLLSSRSTIQTQSSSFRRRY